MLFDNQKNISADIYNSLENKELFNIPTGSGKTYILLDVARKCQIDGRKVIISTPNNALVREMFNTAEDNKFFSENSCSIVIGRDNYVDKEALASCMENGILYDYISNSKDEVLDFLKNKDDVFIDEFDSFATYKNIEDKNSLQDMISQKESIKRSFNEITITNHFFLISKVVYDKNFDISEYVILIDEVHQIAEVAEAVLSHSFSIYDFKNTLSNIKKEVSEEDFKGKESFLRNIKTLTVRSNNLHKKYSSTSKAGTYITDIKEINECFEDVEAALSSREFKNITSKIKKSEDKTYSNYKAHVQKIESYLQNFKNLNLESKSCGIYYSALKGYPNLNISTRSPLGVLNKSFWNKINFFGGVSATTTCGFKPSNAELKYGYERLGLVEKDKKDYPIHFYNRIFPKENIEVYLPIKENYNSKLESVYNDDFKGDSSPYYNHIVEYIYKNYNDKNSIVLCGGYKEAKFLNELFKKIYSNEVNTDYAKATESTIATIKRFKKNGGILFATRNYNTGISLDGELLENLFILKFPFVDFTSKKWQEVKNESEGKFFLRNEREMLITFMQTLGRLQRSKTDKGTIHILDYRYDRFPIERRRKLIDIINEYGTIKNGKIKKAKKEEIGKSEDKLAKLYQERKQKRAEEQAKIERNEFV